MVAFDDAVALGVDAIELDVHLSKDGQVVVIHDPTLERTTNGRGAVADQTADTLSRLDAAWRFEDSGQHRFRGQGIGVPTLEAVLRRHRDMAFIVELKATSVEVAHRALAVVRAADALDRVVFGSFRQEALDVVRRGEGRCVTSASSREAAYALVRSKLFVPPGRAAYQLLQLPEFRKGWRVVSPRLVQLARRRGIPTHVWVVDEEADMRRLLAWGVTGLISDRPDVAMRVVHG